MKKIFFTLAILFLAISSAFSQDSLYVYKNGLVDNKFAVYDIDSLSFSSNLDTLILSKNSTVANTMLIANIDSISFMPSLPTGTYIDIDGNRYTTVTIGTQTWLVENLKTTRYRNGDIIPEIQNNTEWMNLTTGAYSNYDNDPNNGNNFGRLYNWHAVNDSRNLAPAGWHIPSIEEWAILENYLIESGYNYDGSKTINKIAKALAAKTGWKASSDAGAPGNNMTLNNSSGFNGLSGGMRYGNTGVFSNKSDGAYWWTKNNTTNVEAHYRAMFYRYNFFKNYTSLQGNGYAVRCIKSDLPTVSTNTVNDVIINSATSGGNVSFDGHDPVLYKGVCWNTSENPTVNDNITIDGYGLGGFNSTLTNLLPGTTYYVRAYATNTVGTAYGEEFSFKTLATTPTITTMEVSAITDSTATASGVIITDGGATITEKGFCWSTNESPTVADSITTGTGDSIFIGNLTGLNAGTVYYIRSFATNEIGTTYGQQLSFTTLDLPAVTTVEISAITDSSALSGGNILSDGGAEIIAKGVCWSTTENPTISDSISTDGTGIGGPFISNITGLSAGTLYYVRAYATNSVGTAYGNELSFTTLPIEELEE
ncbi:MAG: fibrobacter succinogenes major paralogous domain-containing protein [Paludibacter sp.]|nr:fibrobacter succinogenes major paralogous domain-containing protein [Paludibacter sp.]